MNQIASEIIIILLALCSVGTVILLTLVLKNQKNSIESMEDAYSFLRGRYDESLRTIADINGKYSKCLDERERNLNEYSIKIKKLELEIEAKNAEIERLNRRIAVVELPVDVSKITEVNHEEKEA